MGPGFGRDIARSMTTFGALVLVAGILTGIGCSAGCSYLREHVSIGWDGKGSREP